MSHHHSSTQVINDNRTTVINVYNANLKARKLPGGFKPLPPNADVAAIEGQMKAALSAAALTRWKGNKDSKPDFDFAFLEEDGSVTLDTPVTCAVETIDDYMKTANLFPPKGWSKGVAHTILLHLIDAAGYANPSGGVLVTALGSIDWCCAVVPMNDKDKTLVGYCFGAASATS